jgi:hypothetical protein
LSQGAVVLEVSVAEAVALAVLSKALILVQQKVKLLL